jgi:hypothetical protein
MSRSGLPQLVLAQEGQIAVARAVFDRLMGGVNDGSWRRYIRVHVLQAQDRGIALGIRRFPHAINADTSYVLEPGDGHSNLEQK